MLAAAAVEANYLLLFTRTNPGGAMVVILTPKGGNDNRVDQTNARSSPQ